jgi:amidase
MPERKIRLRRQLHWLWLVLLLVGCGPPPQRTAIPVKRPAVKARVIELGVAEAQRKMTQGEFDAQQLTHAYLKRIAAVDRSGPMLNAVIELNPAAEDDAVRLDAERRAGTVRGPLHGIAVLIKDNIDVVGMATSAGSLALANNRPQHDAFLVERLRQAGAVIIGKTNLSEWANFRSIHSTSGWSSRGGQTRNPYALDRSPCGSSSGTAAAIAASLATVGVGTETDGSIICPAAVNGIVGLKPTVGVVSRRGMVPISKSQDTAGPMGRTVADVAALFGVMAGIDESDPASAAARGKLAADYTSALDADALRGKRFGLLRQTMGTLPQLDAVTEKAAAAITAAGAEVVDVTLDDYGSWRSAELELLLFEFKDGINAYLRNAPSAPASLQALITWNRAHSEAAMPWFGQDLFERAQRCGPLTDPKYLQARATTQRLAGPERLLSVLDAQRLDALIAPSGPPAWTIDLVLGDHAISGSGADLAAIAGTPSITVPMGDIHGLPLGLMFLGRPYAEAQLLGFAYAFEQAGQARSPPRYLEHVAHTSTGPDSADANR